MQPSCKRFYVIILPQSSFYDVLPHNIAHAPRGLQIEAARDGIDVKHLAGKEEVRTHFALERVLVDRRQRHATTGHKLVTKAPLAVDDMLVVGERLHQPAYALLSKLVPTFLLR